MYYKIYDFDFKDPDTKNKYIYEIYPKKYKKIIIFQE
jgi:hypothetical protein